MNKQRWALLAAAIISLTVVLVAQNQSSAPSYDITTLAGKVASVHGTAGLQIRM